MHWAKFYVLGKGRFQCIFIALINEQVKFLFYILHKIEKCRSDFKTVFKFYFPQFLEMMDTYLHVYFQNKRAETERSFLYDLFWKCCSQGQWHVVVSIGTVICVGR